jgi:hypothetical protein
LSAPDPPGPTMTIPALIAILLFVVVLAALNRIEFGRFD